MADFKRVTFTDADANEYALGYHEWIQMDYTGNVQNVIIPRGTGVKLWSTEELGGGVITITVQCFQAKDTRLLLETDLNTLIGNLKAKTGTLTVDSTLTFTNCYFQSFKMGGNVAKESYYSLVFIKSA